MGRSLPARISKYETELFPPTTCDTKQRRYSDVVWIDVICLKGKGFTSVGREQAPVRRTAPSSLDGR